MMMESIPPYVVPLLSVVHLLAVIVWVGGMFFAHMVLRPSALELEAQPRISLWYRVLSRFFPWVWGVVILLPFSGHILYFLLSSSEPAQAIGHTRIMMVLGWVMIFLFVYIYFGLFRVLRVLVAGQRFPEAGQYLNRIRRVVGINLVLGLVTSTVAVVGRYFLF